MVMSDLAKRAAIKLREENIRRSERAGIPVGKFAEKPVGLKKFRKKQAQSATRAREAQAEQIRRIKQGGRVSPR